MSTVDDRARLGVDDFKPGRPVDTCHATPDGIISDVQARGLELFDDGNGEGGVMGLVITDQSRSESPLMTTRLYENRARPKAGSLEIRQQLEARSLLEKALKIDT